MNPTVGFDAPLDLRAYTPDEWVVLNALTYRARDLRAFIVHKGFITDLASIPRLLRPVLDSNGKSRRPAVLHDSLYCRQLTRRADADLLFLEALELEGVGWAERTALYLGVRSFGWLYWRKRSAGLTPDDFAEVAHGAD